MSSNRLRRRKGVVSSGVVNSTSNSLDWDSPSTKTGTVKRRPISGDCTLNNSTSNNNTKKDTDYFNQSSRSSNEICEDFKRKPIKTGIPTVRRVNKYFGKDPSSPIQFENNLNPIKIKAADAFPILNKCVDESNSANQLLPVEANTYLIERKSFKAGKVSDSDSGIASPLSPSSVYGFPLCTDKNDCREKDSEDARRKLLNESTFYFSQHIQVKIYVLRYM